MFDMKRRLGIMLLIFVLTATGCSTTTSKATDVTSTNTKAEQTSEQSAEASVEEDFFSDLFAADEMTNSEISTMLASDSYEDLIAASPFYTSDLFRMQFEDQTYFKLRETVIDTTIQTGNRMYENGQKLTLMVEEAQKVILSAYAEKAGEADVLADYYQTMLNDYSDALVYLSMLKAQIDGLEALTGDAYTDAWFTYMRLTKQNDFVTREVAWIARLVQDALLLYDAYPDELGYLEDEVVSLSAKETEITALIDDLYTITSQLEQLEKADAYATISLLKYMAHFNETIQPSLKALTPREGLDQEAIDFESIRLMGATLIDLYALDDRYATGESKAVMAPSSLLTAVLTAASSEATSSESAMSDAEATLETTPKKTESPGFFNVMYNAIRKVPGILIEKTSTAVYKQALNYYADDYGLDESVFDEEKERADKEAYNRIQSGTGSETIHAAQNYITKAEDSIGKLSDTMLGEDSTLSQVIKGSSKFTIGCFTGAAKSMLTLMDSTASVGDLAKATVDVSLAAVASSKSVEKIFKVGKSKVLSFFGIKASTATAAKETTKALLGKASTVISKVKNAAGNFIESALGTANQGSKFGKFISGAGEVLSKATSNIVSSSKKIFSSIADSSSSLYNTLTGKIGSISQKAVQNEGFISKAIGGSYTEVLTGYVKGCVYDQIPTFVDSTMDWVASETEAASAADTTGAISGDSLSAAAEAAATSALGDVLSNNESVSTESDNDVAAPDTADAVETEDSEADSEAEPGAAVDSDDAASSEADTEVIGDSEAASTSETGDDSQGTADTDEAGNVEETEAAESTEENSGGTADPAPYYGTYKGAYQPSKIAGMTLDFNDSNTIFTMEISESKIVVSSAFNSPMLEGDTMTFSTYSISADGKMRLSRIDDEGDKQVINVQFLEGHRLTGAVTLYDGSTAIGDLKFYGQ
jgi:hypothetical protein